MRNMEGMRGDDDEQPANNSAKRCVSIILL
jgi:hypothetical protein